MGDAVGSVTDSLGKAYEMVKKDGMGLFKSMLGVSVFSTLIMVAGFTIAVAIAALLLIPTGALEGTTPNVGMVWVAMTIAAVIMFAAMLLSAAAGAVSYNVVDGFATGKKISIMERFRANIVPISIFEVLWLIVILILALPIALSLLTGMSVGSTSMMALFCGLTVLSVVLIIGFSFSIQFSMLEIVIAGKDAIEAMKSSISFVRANMGGVLLLDFVIFVLALAIGGASTVIRTIIGFIPSITIIGGVWGLIAGYVIYFVLAIVLGIITSAVSQTIVHPVIYMFWKKK